MVVKVKSREGMAFPGLLMFVSFGAGVSKVTDQFGSWDTGSEVGTKAVIMHPFKRLVCIADDNETIRYCFYAGEVKERYSSLPSRGVN